MLRADLSLAAEAQFDLIVIGGGVNGVAIARDAAMRGMSVALMEKDDLASGTSAWSSRLIHGGLRYLEHREFGLVRESLRERELLLRNAPHLVAPLAMVVPIYKGAKRGPLTIRAGMAAYDALSYDKSLPLHRMLRSQQVEQRLPGLDSSGLRAGAVYYDAQATFAERLVIEQAISAWEHGATIANRARVTGIVSDGAVVRGVRVVDDLSGDEHHLRGKIVVNVAGPWVDQVLLGAPKGTIGQRFIGGTKGSHIVVERWEGAPDDAVYYESRADGRPILVIPWNGMMLLGSTDLRYDGDLDRVDASDEEIEYLINEVNTLFPEVRLSTSDVLYSYAGIRPLPYVAKGATGAITRQHVIKDHAPILRGLWSIIGGKLTTHRSLAEEVVTKAVRALGMEAECMTGKTPFPGAAGVVPSAFAAGFVNHAAKLGINMGSAHRLAALYGVRAEAIAELVRVQPELGQVVDDASGGIAAEAVYAVQSEMAISLADVLLRRSMLGYGATAGIGTDAKVLETAGSALGWKKTRQRTELNSYRAWIQRYRPGSLDHPSDPAE